ncbi:hypothetical protein DE146DRAFT_340939 [Phaeosphaeria sp. MPI-PUGE-AT-0046c]|nr:hypothetical protein DE146DRAFT_340939 [Phaeosphaeria sp. MPI-PUGE-AT-0046c]
MHYSPRTIAGVVAFFAFTALYIITAVSARDPTSIYFSPRKGYTPRYSAIRRSQAEQFILAYDAVNPIDVVKASPDEKKRKLCVGIPSTYRNGVGYLPDTVASLIEGLSPEERQEIYIMVFIPHSKPETHPAYNEKWLPGLVDKVITYQFGYDRMQHIRIMEQAGGRVEEKAIFDYAYLLNKCAEQFTPYIAILEDDTLAMHGWYHRTMAAIHEAEQQAALRRSKPDFLYLRLFYTEEFLGWNRQRWKSYLWLSICAAALPTAFLVLVRVFQPRTKLSITLTTRRAFLTLYSVLAVLILFYFSLGRITVHPIPNGVHEMPRFGCCSQAYVFPNLKAQDLVTYFKERHVGYTDVLLEDFANERDELRFAITPSVVQHLGRKIEKSGDAASEEKVGKNMVEKIWSFAFEKFDVKALNEEHEKVKRLRIQGL